jgi:hypothetical protein
MERSLKSHAAEETTHMRTLHRISFALFLTVIVGAAPAFAQTTEPETSILVGTGAVNFDLSGTGTSPGFTVRVSHTLTSNILLEGSLLFVPLEQQFEDDATLLVPEVQLQYHWPLGRFTPFVGAGVGFARVNSEFRGAEWDPAVSFAGGTRMQINDYLGAFGEFRIRGVEWDFVGTTADIMGGLVIRLGR